MRFTALVMILLGMCVTGQTQRPQAGENSTLFLEVRVFDGKNETLSTPSSVLIKGNRIERISTSPIDASRIANVPCSRLLTFSRHFDEGPYTKRTLV